MPRTYLYISMTLLACCLGHAFACRAFAQVPPVERADETMPPVQPPIALDHHRWARFAVGAWKRVRIVEQVLDADGRVISETTMFRTERLDEVGPRKFTLTTNVSTEIGGRQVPAPAKESELDLITEEPGRIGPIERSAAEVFSMGDRDVDVQVLTAVTGGDVYTVSTRLWYSPDVSPYVMRSESEAVSPASQATMWHRTRKVITANVPFAVDGQMAPAAFVEELHASTKATRHTMLAWVDKVPGGIVARSTKEINAEGRVIRWEVETLVDWGRGGHYEDGQPPQPEEPVKTQPGL